MPLLLTAFLFFFCFLPAGFISAQDQRLDNISIHLAVQDKPLQEALSLLEAQVPFKFAYSTDLILHKNKVTVIATGASLSSVLNEILKGTSLTYKVIGNQIVLEKMIMPGMITLSGYVKDARSGELLPGASIYLPELKTGGFSNNYGFYSIAVPAADTASIELSYVGYKNLNYRVSAKSDSGLNFSMEHNRQRELIQQFTVAHDKREDNVKKNQPAMVDLSDDMLTTIPSFSGGGDVMNAIQMLPGVQAGMDGTPGYSVRGGNTGQNLILLDEATLYNPSHMFGMVSIFNGPAIKNANLLKGGFPASYGDHISSVLDIAMKDGNRQQYGGTLQLGPIASGLTLYGPLQQDKSSFLVGARRSAIDWWLHPFSSNSYFSNYYFYDLNAKLNCLVSPKDRLLFSFYRGLDKNAYYTNGADSSGIDYGMHFGNTAFTFRWNHQYSGKLFSNTSLIFNRYHQFLSASQEGYFAQLYSGMQDMNAKTDISYYPSNAHKVSAGINYLYQTLFPASVSARNAGADSSLFIDPGSIPRKNATRIAIYMSDEIRLGKRFDVYAGIRVPLYYRENIRYLQPEPRISVLYLAGTNTSIKTSYTQMHQYIHLVQSYNASFPAEIWLGSSSLVLPELSHEFSAGVYKNFKENVFQVSLEGYYKMMGHQLLFRGNTSHMINNSMEEQLIFGKGWSYGLEFLLRKNRGKLKGWLAYALAYANQQFDSLNFGTSFPFALDRRHSLCMAAAYDLGLHWKLSADLFIASGRAFTLGARTDSLSASSNSNPLYDDENDPGLGGTSRALAENNYRLTPYSRLDLGISYRTSKLINRRLMESEWIFSVYNVYAHRNTSFAYRTIDPLTGQVIAKEVSLIPVIPTLTYTLRF